MPKYKHVAGGRVDVYRKQPNWGGIIVAIIVALVVLGALFGK